MFVFQFKSQQPAPFPVLPTAFSLTLERTGEAIRTLTQENYASTLQTFLASLHNSSDAQKAAFCDLLLQLNSSLSMLGPIGRTELQRSFMYELASAVAPAWAAREAKNDYAALKDDASKDAFRKKYGYYDQRSRKYNIHHDQYNNCRHYVLKKYYAVLKEFLSSEASLPLGPDSFTIRKKDFYGRPKNFDYQSNVPDAPVQCFQQTKWESMSQPEKEFYLTGQGVAYVAYTFPARSTKKILAFLQAGDLVSANVSIHTGNGHVGIYDGNGNVVNTGSPLYDEKLKKFARKSGVITVRRLVSRTSTSISALPLMEEQNPWTQPISFTVSKQK